MKDRLALVDHPELAQLWTLHYSGRMALRLIECIHQEPERGTMLVVDRLRRAVTDLLAAVEDYRGHIEMFPALEVRFPVHWGPEQAEAMLGFVSTLRDHLVDHEERTAEREFKARVAQAEASASSCRTRPR